MKLERDRYVFTMVKVVVVGANGYSGEELCALLAAHPLATLESVTSRKHAGKPVTEVLPRLAGRPGVNGVSFGPSTIEHLTACEAPYVFLALPHGLAGEFAAPLVAAGKRVIDLSADFRLNDVTTYQEFYGEEHSAPDLLEKAVYGIPELHRAEIAKSQLVASAGCYPTSILLPLVPLLKAGLLDKDSIAVSSASGVSGAGRKADESLLFAECNESFRSYSVPKHRHLSEIEQELSLAAGSTVTITFIPHLIPMNRGIHSTIMAKPRSGVSAEEVAICLQTAYADEPFVRLPQGLPDTKNTVGTNFCDIAVRYDARTGRLILLSAIDNLVKGAAGQAVQNFNLMAGFPETSALL